MNTLFMKCAVVPLLMLLPMLSDVTEDPPALVTRTWTVEGVERTALVRVPASIPESGAPLVFGFHGHGGNMNQAARSFRYHELWPEAVVVYMQGLPTPGALTDPLGKKNGWQKNIGDQGDRDLHFFDAVLASLRQEVKIDEKRIYVTGHSNGGAFTYLLWAARGEVFAAAAPSASLMIRNIRMLKPLPVLHVAGEDDELVRFGAQQRMMNYVRRINGCDETGVPWAQAGTLTGTLYPSSTGTPFVSLIHPGSHRFPADAPGLIVKFFQEHAKQ